MAQVVWQQDELPVEPPSLFDEQLDAEQQDVAPDTRITEMSDGSVEVEIGVSDVDVKITAIPFDGNLVTVVDQRELDKIASDLISDFEDDKRSRADWEKTIKSGIELLGMKIENVTDPFPGACGAHHPLLMEAVLQFQGNAMAELFPASGPVRTTVVGKNDEAMQAKARRVREFMNFQLTELMDDYFDDLDQMLFWLPVAGSMFRKVYWTGTTIESRFINPDDFVVSDKAVNLKTCRRITHVIRIDANEFKKLQRTGFYADIDLPEPGSPDKTDIVEVVQQTEGVTPNDFDDQSRTLLECHVDLEIESLDKLYPDETWEGLASPYVVTIDKDSAKVVSVKRNWNEGDEQRERIAHFVHYKFLPGFGFYGTSLIHMLGNLQKSATAALRSLIDSGMFANFQAGFKAKGLRASNTRPLKFGEFRDVEAYGDDLAKGIFLVPSKEPSQVLFQLLGSLADNGRRVAAVANMNTSDMNQEAPVGTTLALMEQGLKLMSGIHRRLHKAQRDELRLIARLNGSKIDPEYPYQTDDGAKHVLRDDFDAQIDVLPVTDPNTFSETQRIMRAQAKLQLAQQFPQQHNLREAIKGMHISMGDPNPDKILMPEIGAKQCDPVTENLLVMSQRPIKAFPDQDHAAHLEVHFGFLQDPGTGGNPQVARVIQPQMLAHIGEHLGYLYRQQFAAQMPMPNAPVLGTTPAGDQYQQLPPEAEAALAKAQAAIAAQVKTPVQIPDLTGSGQEGQDQAAQTLAQAALLRAKSNAEEAQSRIADRERQFQFDVVKHRDEMQLEDKRLVTNAAVKGAELRGKAAITLANNRGNSRKKGEK